MISNPLYDFWVEAGGGEDPIDRLLKIKKSGIDPKQLHFERTRFTDASTKLYKARDVAIKRWAWAVPLDGHLDRIAKLSPILEVGAGSGYWANLLAARGVDIIATDLFGERNPKSRTHSFDEIHFPIMRIGAARAVERYPERTLLFVWPGYGSDWAYEAAQKTRALHVVSVGEGYGGCTATDRFHKYLSDEKRWDLEFEESIPQWYGMHDRITIHWRRDAVTS